MVHLNNIKKFLSDHPEIGAEEASAIMDRAKANAGEGGCIAGGSLHAILGAMAEKFTYDFHSDPQRMVEHIAICCRDLNIELKGQ